MPARKVFVLNAPTDEQVIDVHENPAPVKETDKAGMQSYTASKKSEGKYGTADDKVDSFAGNKNNKVENMKINDLRNNKDPDMGKGGKNGKADGKNVDPPRNNWTNADNMKKSGSGNGKHLDDRPGRKDGNADSKIRGLVGKKKTNSNETEMTKMTNGKSLDKADDMKSGHHLPWRITGFNKCLHVFLFLFLFGNDVADFISDWLFFADVVIAEKGLVYGPPEPAAVWCLLLFSIIGTFTFCFECANLWWEFFRNNPWIDSDWLSAIVIWIEDVPQVLISLYLVLCREESISIFQLSKAAVILIGVVIRIIVTSVKYCNKDAVRSHHHVKIKAVIMLGIIIEAMAAGAIFFLTQTERNDTGDIAFRIPSTVVEDTYNDRRYFENVSVFFHNADLFDVGNLDLNKTDHVVNWLRLVSVYSIREGDYGMASFKIEYGYTGNNTINLAISDRQQDEGNWTLSACYNINQNVAVITDVANTTCAQPAFFTNSTSVFIKLQYEKPGSIFKRKVFGDIHMNIKKLQNGVCTSLSKYADSIDSSINSNIPLTFHYYRTNKTLRYLDIKHLLYQSGMPRFFENKDSDLADVSLQWKTGWRECASNGNTAPIFDSNLALTCS